MPVSSETGRDFWAHRYAGSEAEVDVSALRADEFVQNIVQAAGCRVHWIFVCQPCSRGNTVPVFIGSSKYLPSGKFVRFCIAQTFASTWSVHLEVVRALFASVADISMVAVPFHLSSAIAVFML
jgi:hypothetical protein